MSDETISRISALLDHEPDHGDLDKTLQALTDDDRLRTTAIRYRMIGDALRGDGVRADAPQLADRIRRAIGDEPAILAPASSQSGRGRAALLTRLAGGVAIAATVAAVAIAVFPRVEPLPGTEANTVALAPGLPRQMPTQATPAPATITTATGTSASGASKLTSWEQYLLDHEEFAARGLTRGIRPHATLVAIDDR